MTKLLESTKQALHLITGICRVAYDYKMYNKLFFFLGKDAWHSHPFSKGIIDNYNNSGQAKAAYLQSHIPECISTQIDAIHIF